MSSNNVQTASRLPIDKWEAESLRVTLFPTEPYNPDKQSWWSDLLGSPADRIVRDRKTGSYHERGPFRGELLVLGMAHGRIDWILGIESGGSIPDDPLRTIGPFPSTLDKFAPVIEKWLHLPTCPTAVRLGFGAVLLYPVGTHKETMQQLQAYLNNVKIDPSKSRDLFYQINRPIASKIGIPNLMINRLCKWSVFDTKTVLARVSVMPAKVQDIQEKSACRLELDINTSREFNSELTADYLPLVFKELVELGKEIVENGDINGNE